MTILINAISARQGGGQTYLNNLLSRIPPDFSRRIIVLDNQLLDFKYSHPKLERFTVSGRIVRNPFARAFWERFLLPAIIRRLGVELYFAPGGLLSIGRTKGLKIVTMCRDMLPFDIVQRRKYGLSYMRFRNWLLSMSLVKSFEKADHVIFVSDFARHHLQQVLNCRIRDCSVIKHGIDPQFLASASEQGPFGELKPFSYFLYVSTIDVYKAQVEVVKAFALWKAKNGPALKLVLAGASYAPYLETLKAAIAEWKLENDVILLGKVPHDSLPGLYRHALANIFASECENCPNILLESLGAGRPVLCSNRPPMDEFGEDKVRYFNPTYPHELADLMQKVVLEGPHETDSSVAHELASKYSWEATSARTWKLLEKL